MSPTIALLAVALQLNTAPDTSLRLYEFTEVFSWPVPEDHSLAGAALGTGGAFVAVFEDRGYVAVVDGAQLRWFGDGILIHPVGAALVENNAFLEVIDAGLGQALRFTRDGTLLDRWALHLPFDLTHAARAEGGWYVGGVASEGGKEAFAVWWIAADGTASLIYEEQLPAGPFGSRVEQHLSTAGSNALVTRVTPQYATLRIDSVGAVLREYSPFSSPELQQLLSQDSTRLWVSLPAVDLGQELLQTIADVRSDRRVLVLFDRSGTVARYSELDVSWGALAARPSDRLLIAARRADRISVVGYSWRRFSRGPPCE